MSRPPSRLSNTSKAVVNMPLLCAALGVSIAALMIHLLASMIAESSLASFLLSSMTMLIFAVALCYAIFEIFRQGLRAWKDPSATTSICMSALLGCFLLGVVIVLLADPAPPGTFSKGAGVAFSLFSLIGLLFLLFLGDNSPGTMVPIPLEESTPAFPVLPLVRSNPDLLPPLFQDDALYRLPSARSARYHFLAAVKGNEQHLVFSDDACVVAKDETRFALCDGASASSLPRSWAALLGQQWLKSPLFKPDGQALLRWLEEPRHLWAQWVQEIWLPTVNQRNQLIGEPRVQKSEFEQILYRGAASTFLGLSIDYQSKHWRATAVGDTCLFLIYKESSMAPWQIVDSMPLKNAASFTQTPPLLDSQQGHSVDHLVPYVHSYKGTYRHGDVLLLATDALAQWLLTQKEQGRSEWQKLLSMTNQQTFLHFVFQQRERGEMEDDDTTLLVIQL